MTLRFRPEARGRLRDDTPNYWRENLHALSNLCRAEALATYAFARLPPPNQAAVISRARHVATVLAAEYIRIDLPRPSSEGDSVLFARSTQDVDEINALEDARVRAARRERRGSTRARRWETENELNDCLAAASEEARIVRAGKLMALIDYVGDADFSAFSSDPPHFGPDPESDNTFAFLSAFDLCFTADEHPARVWMDIVDRVLLPFWRHRWRLFEVWSILWMLRTLPPDIRPEARLIARDDAPGSFTWTLPGGEAKSPVASIELPDRTLSVWFQLKTQLAAEDAARFGKQRHIEPDIRLRESRAGHAEVDLAVLELKDRHLAGGSAEKKVARMYATVPARVVCVSNYSQFSSKMLRGKVYTELIGPTTIYVIDSGGPGRMPEEVAQAIRDAACGGSLDILIDISRSVDRAALRRAVEALPQDLRDTAHWYAWATGFHAAQTADEALGAVDAGTATDVAQALRSYEALATERRAIILTDSDGVAQFEQLAAEIDAARYQIVDISAGMDDVAVSRLAT